MALESTSGGPVRVMLVDDSAVIRGVISRILENDPDIKVVHSSHNGEVAVNSIARVMPEVVLLDIEMPVMDGITALPQLLKNYPKAKVIMCSTLTEKGAKVSMKALQLGATEYICKPSSTRDNATMEDFKISLLAIVKSVAQSMGHKFSTQRTAPSAATSSADMAQSSTTAAPRPLTGDKSFKLRDASLGWQGKPSVLAIGSSTGGPKALFKVSESLKGLDIPIVITQHMPPTFTKILAQHIEQHSGVKCYEGETGMKIETGNVYIAPGGYHMLFEKDENGLCIALNEEPPENFCRPSVDPMMRSLIEIYGKKILAVILTGMGADGLKSCRTLVETGGVVVAQDEASSIVWGMPGAVAMDGICTQVLPLDQVGPWVRKRITSG